MTTATAIATAAAAASAVIERPAMTAALDIAIEAVEKRNTLPILSNVRLLGEAGSALFVTATDLDIEITARVPAASDASFATTVPAHMLRDFLKKAPKSDYISLTGGFGKVTADFERVRYALQTQPVSDFPDLKGPETACAFDMDGEALFRALDRVKGAVSTEETRYYLNGVYFHAHYDGGLRMVATDGHRLYLQEIATPQGAAEIPGVIIPRKTVATLHKLMKGKKCPESVAVEISDTKARFIFDTPDGVTVTLTSKLVDGTFPDYQRVIPAHNDKLASFGVADMVEAIKGVSLVQSERGRAVKMAFASGDVRLSVNNPDAGSAEADVACAYGCDPMEIGFNAGYLADVLAIASADDVTMAMADSGAPAIFTADHLEGFKAVLMPMRV